MSRTRGRTRIGEGAEALVYLSEDKAGGEAKREAVKERVSKGYRLPEIDMRLRRNRTRQEGHILAKLAASDFPSPRLFETRDDTMELRMEFLTGEKLRDFLDHNSEINATGELARIALQIGRHISLMHTRDIIHGDLTTSNMILQEGTVYFIDFGLGFFSTKTEDKAVDLHLLHRALDSKHPRIAEAFFQRVLEGYCRGPDSVSSGPAEDVIARLVAVEKRGRYRKGS